MSGYDGYSMSNRARAAYEDGERPISKWTKSDILEGIREFLDDKNILEDIAKYPKDFLKRYFLEQTSWHHTSKLYRETDFYSINEDYVQQVESGEVVLEEHFSYYKETRSRETAVEKARQLHKEGNAEYIICKIPCEVDGDAFCGAVNVDGWCVSMNALMGSNYEAWPENKYDSKPCDRSIFIQNYRNGAGHELFTEKTTSLDIACKEAKEASKLMAQNSPDEQLTEIFAEKGVTIEGMGL